jgi:hypothetical protein
LRANNEPEEDTMSDDDFELIHGSGNVFRDYGEVKSDPFKKNGGILAGLRPLFME